jgi:hypothetical protein
MINFRLPFVALPGEFVTLLKSSLSLGETSAPVFDLIRPNAALYSVLDSAFSEFNDGRGLEKLMMTLGWPNFRDRMASLYIHKCIHGRYPNRTNLELVEEMQRLENRFVDQSVHSYSRVFLLGFYLKLANLTLKEKVSTHEPLAVSAEVEAIIKMAPGRTEKIDWLILTVMHFQAALGESILMSALNSGKDFEKIYEMMDADSKMIMNQNLLAYAASIHDPEIFLYEKV